MIEAEHAVIVEHPRVMVEVVPLLIATEVSQALLVCVEHELVELDVLDLDSEDLESLFESVCFDVGSCVFVGSFWLPVGSFELPGGPG